MVRNVRRLRRFFAEYLESRRGRLRRRGVALILVLASLTMLTLMLTEFQTEVSTDLGSALTKRDALKVEYAARSGINLTRLLIASEPSIRESLAPVFAMLQQPAPQIPVWNFADQVLGAFNDDIGRESFAAFAGVVFGDPTEHKLGLQGARFEVQVVEEESKINVNMPAGGGIFQQEWLVSQLTSVMAGEQFDLLFGNRDLDGNFSDRRSVCGEIIDFTDPNQDAHPCDPTTTTAQAGGPELDYYSQLKRPYQRKNAAFDTLEELRMVRGIGDAFWSKFVEPDPDDPQKRVFTVWTDERINVNSANAQVILALICSNAEEDQAVCTDPVQAASFLSLIGMVRAVSGGAPLFASPSDFRRTMEGQSKSSIFAKLKDTLGLPTVKFKGEIEKLVTTTSKVFSIYATGILETGKRETRRRIQAVVDFRKAPLPGAATLQSNTPGSSPSTSSTTGAPPVPSVQLPEGASPDALTNLFRPNPAGTVIYYKVD